MTYNDSGKLDQEANSETGERERLPLAATTITARDRIAALLRGSKRPLTNVEISALTGTPIQQVKNILARFREFRNVGSTKARAFYVYVPDAPAKAVPKEPSCDWRFTTYTGERCAPHRPGADDFLRCPSVENGARVDRRRPALISMRT